MQSELCWLPAGRPSDSPYVAAREMDRQAEHTGGEGGSGGESPVSMNLVNAIKMIRPKIKDYYTNKK
jgi:hypothetical protein